MADDNQPELEGITTVSQSTSLDGRLQRELVRAALFGDDEPPRHQLLRRDHARVAAVL